MDDSIWQKKVLDTYLDLSKLLYIIINTCSILECNIMCIQLLLSDYVEVYKFLLCFLSTFIFNNRGMTYFKTTCYVKETLFFKAKHTSLILKKIHCSMARKKVITLFWSEKQILLYLFVDVWIEVIKGILQATSGNIYPYILRSKQ